MAAESAEGHDFYIMEEGSLVALKQRDGSEPVEVLFFHIRLTSDSIGPIGIDYVDNACFLYLQRTDLY